MQPEPYRADHIGSFLRPPELLEARGSGTDPARLHAIEDRCILDVLAHQRAAGMSVFTDGELRRRNFTGDFFAAVDGFGTGDEVKRSWRGSGDRGLHTGAPGAVHARLRQHSRLTAHELPFLRAHSPGPIKMTLPSPTQFPAQSYRKGITDAVYADHSELLRDIVEIISGEVAALAGEGVDYVQLDAPRYSYYVDPKWRSWLQAEMQADPETLLTEALAADNTCLRAASGSAMTRAIHLCRGNNRSQWYAEGGYDPIAERLFNTLEVDRFLLEYDDERSGSFEPLRFVPKGKTVVLGLISSKRGALEDAESVVRRIEEAAKFVPLENLALSPQCGFASGTEGNLLSADEQWAKLRLVAEVTARVWR
jgi:5-methyltetrahydropteroyltriglutamate--homocysteine methyltransferase